MTVESSLPIGKPTDKVLDTTQVTQTDGTVAEREAVVITDPETLANRQKVSADGISYTSTVGVASTGNTSTDALEGDATYTGTGEQNDYPDVMVSCQTDAAGTLYFDFSVDGTNWTTFPVNGFAVAAGIHEFHEAVKGPRYFRARLVNRSDAQSYLRLYTYYGTFRQGNSPLNQTVGLDTNAAHVRPTSFQDEVRIGRRSGITGWTKSGYRTELTAANGEETIWATTGNYTPATSADTWNIAYDGTAGGSTDGAGTTGALTLAFYYIDGDGNEAVSVHTLETDGTDTTSFSGYGINRIAVASSGTAKKNTSAITVTHTTSGDKHAIIPAGESVAQQAIFHMGASHDGVAKFLFMNVRKPGGGNAKVTVKGYVYNRSPAATTYEIFRALIDTQTETFLVIDEPIGLDLGPTDVLYFVADTDTNATLINMRFSLNTYQRA
jgi:hypothetical protein